MKRDDVTIDEYNSLSNIERDLLYKIHTKMSETGKSVSFSYIFLTFKSDYSFEELRYALNQLKKNGYLKEECVFETTFERLECSETKKRKEKRNAKN